MRPRPPIAPKINRAGAEGLRSRRIQSAGGAGPPTGRVPKRPRALALQWRQMLSGAGAPPPEGDKRQTGLRSGTPLYTHPAASSTTDDVRTQWNALPTRNAKPQPSGAEEVKYSLKPVSLAPKVQERGTKQRK